MPIFQHFTAFYEHLCHWNETQTQLNILKLCWIKVPGLNTHFLAIFELLFIYNSKETPKNVQKCHFDGSLRHKKYAEWWRVALHKWMNMSECQNVIIWPWFDKSNSFTPQKLAKMPFLRYFTAFYGITCVYLNRMCSITFFGFYGIVTKGSWQKIGSYVTFGISLRVYLHMTQWVKFQSWSLQKQDMNCNARRPSLVVNSLFPHSASHTNARCFSV